MGVGVGEIRACAGERSWGGLCYKGRFLGVGMGIRNPQNSEEQPRKSGSLGELGGSVWQESIVPEKGRPVPSWGVHLPPGFGLPGFPTGVEEGKGGRS